MSVIQDILETQSEREELERRIMSAMQAYRRAQRQAERTRQQAERARRAHARATRSAAAARRLEFITCFLGSVGNLTFGVTVFMNGTPGAFTNALAAVALLAGTGCFITLVYALGKN